MLTDVIVLFTETTDVTVVAAHVLAGWVMPPVVGCTNTVKVEVGVGAVDVVPDVTLIHEQAIV